MYYPCSENKDADQLRGYREADLRLCFRPCKLLFSSRTGSFHRINQTLYEPHHEKTGYMPMRKQRRLADQCLCFRYTIVQFFFF